MGNLLRYPSVVFNNYGLQRFIPYLMAILIIAIPVLILEIAIGVAYRGGSVVAYNAMYYRFKGTGLGLLFIGFFIGHYFVIILAWIMTYFRYSFRSPLPWEGNGQAFYMDTVVANPQPIVGSLSPDGSTVLGYTEYPAVGLVGETVGWVAFTWFLVWLCIFRGVGLTSRVVYFTMGIPIFITIVLIGRGVSLPSAVDGIRLYFARWRGETLASGQIWQAACGQVFFSTDVGFGYFTSYASYNTNDSNAVMDSIIICCSNALFDTLAAFAVFGAIGFVGLMPESGVRLGTFTVGFLTLPEAVTEMPGAQFWAAILFLCLMVLGFSSSFAMLDAVVTMIMDAQGAVASLKRPAVVTILVVVSFLLGLPYSTQFGYYLLEGIDRWINDVALIFVVWAEIVSATTIYRWKDVTDQVGMSAFVSYNAAYFGGIILGPAIGHAVSPPAGAGVGFGIFIIGTAIAILIAKTPDAKAARFWGNNAHTSRAWYLAFNSGNQLPRDLNVVVGTGKNWTILWFWTLLMRYISAPILAIVYSFAYPSFYQLRYDPLHIAGFTLAHFVLVIIVLGFIVPRWYAVFVPPSRRDEGKERTTANVSSFLLDSAEVQSQEEGRVSSEEESESEEKKADGVGHDEQVVR